MVLNMSISKTVEELVGESPVLLWSIEAGIINYSAAAEYLKPSIERRLKKKVSTESILMGLRRINLVHSKNLNEKLRSVINQTKYSVESGFTDLVVDYALEDIPKLTKLIENMEKGENVSLIMGFKYASIVTDSAKLIDEIERSPIGIIDNLGSLAIFRIKLPKSAVEVPGVIALFTSEFAKRGVNVIELESSYLEIGYVIREDEIEKALDAFRSLKTK